MTKTIAKYLDKQQLDAAIKSISTRGAKLDSDIQAAALSAVNHLEQHGDIGFVNKLYLAMPKGSRRGSLAQWFLYFAKVSANIEANKNDVPFLFDKSKENDLAGATAMQWYEAQKDKTPEDCFDIKKALAALLAKASKSPSVNDPKLLETLKAFNNLPATV